MKIRIGKSAPKRGFYLTYGTYAWFYGVNLLWFRITIFPGCVTFSHDGTRLHQHRHFDWVLR